MPWRLDIWQDRVIQRLDQKCAPNFRSINSFSALPKRHLSFPFVIVYIWG